MNLTSTEDALPDASPDKTGHMQEVKGQLARDEEREARIRGPEYRVVLEPVRR